MSQETVESAKAFGWGLLGVGAISGMVIWFYRGAELLRANFRPDDANLWGIYRAGTFAGKVSAMFVIVVCLVGTALGVVVLVMGIRALGAFLMRVAGEGS